MKKIGLVGCGTIGTILAKYINKNDEFTLTHIFDTDNKKVDALKKKLKKKPLIAKDVSDLFKCDLVIEAASHDAVEEYGPQIVANTCIMIMSVGALSQTKLFQQLVNTATKSKTRIYIPSGSIAGLDAIKSTNEVRVDRVTLTTRKPPKALEGIPYVEKNKISLHSIKKPTVIFKGNAKEASKHFPKNINISVSLSLAGVGIEKTKVKIIVDPFTDRNVHEIEAVGEFGKIVTKTENVPSSTNPKTSYLAALSAITTLKNINNVVHIGT